VSKKVLIITYYWPPSGGAGVQRWVKFAKYLPEFGWEPVILTVDQKYAAYPVTDTSLQNEISPSLEVYRTAATDYFALLGKDRSRIPSAGFAINPDDSLKGKISRFVRGNFFIPDPRKGWNRHAFRKASELITSMDIRHVITTSPPHSTQLIGMKLRKKYKDIKWIADLRDSWTDIYYYKQFYPTFISKKIDSRFERKVLKNADTIITAGEKLRNLFASKVPGIIKKTEVLTNGFDEEDFKSCPGNDPVIFTITYAGTLSDLYPIDSFLDALQEIGKSGNRFLLRFIGSVSRKQKELIISKIDDENLMLIPYVEHSEAVRFMCSSSLLILVVPRHENNRSITPGKIFEYLATGKPVLCIGPADGDAAAIIESAAAGETFDYSDTPGMKEFLMKLIENRSVAHSGDRKEYSRRQLTAKLSEILK
jgi:glycosyltransferase involved in cell wall biosynthesis